MLFSELHHNLLGSTSAVRKFLADLCFQWKASPTCNQTSEQANAFCRPPAQQDHVVPCFRFLLFSKEKCLGGKSELQLNFDNSVCPFHASTGESGNFLLKEQFSQEIDQPSTSKLSFPSSPPLCPDLQEHHREYLIFTSNSA